MHLPRWELLAAILVMVVVLGFFLPPVSIILMTAPIILPPLRAADFDIIWFGVVMTIVMEMGLIHPPVGLNIFVIRNVAPDIPLSEVIWGTLPFVLLMMVAVLLLCFFPQIATWLPDIAHGLADGRADERPVSSLTLGVARFALSAAATRLTGGRPISLLMVLVAATQLAPCRRRSQSPCLRACRRRLRSRHCRWRRARRGSRRDRRRRN